jgi:hypothetical protein
MIVVPLTCVRSARGQDFPTDTEEDETVVDTIRVQTGLFKPNFRAHNRADVTSLALGGDFILTLRLPYGFRLTSTIGSEQEEFRLQDRSNNNRRLTNSLRRRLPGGWAFDVKQLDSRTMNRTITVGGGIQNVIVNRLGFASGLRRAYIEEEKIRWDARILGSADNSEKTFKTDRSMTGEIAGGVAYSFFGQGLVLSARGYGKQTDGSSKSVYEEFGGLYVLEDSVSAAAVVQLTDSLRFGFTYDEFNAEEKYTDQRRGSFGGQIEGAENLFVEQRLTDSRIMGVYMNTRVLNGLTLTMDAQHSEDVEDFQETEARYSRNVTDAIKSAIGYRLFTGTEFSADLSVNESLKDLGPQSVSSFDQRQNRISISGRHLFASGLAINVSAGTQLTQSFYLRYAENPRDQDLLDQRLSATVSSKAFGKLQTSVSMTTMQTEFVSIDQTLSSNNRTTTRYDFRPVFTYQLNPRITIRQNYGLVIEFTDHTFFPSKNYLDRNFTFVNDLGVNLTENVRGSFYYGYQFHDRGSYVPQEEGGERLLNIDREDRRDQIKLDLEYRVNKNLTFFGKNDYSRKEDRTIGSDKVRIVEDGGIEIGVRGKYGWGQGRDLTFACAKVNRFGEFNTDLQNDYWNMSAQFNYGF